MILYIGIQWEIIYNDHEKRKRSETLGMHIHPEHLGIPMEKPIPRRQSGTQAEFCGQKRECFKWEEAINLHVTALSYNLNENCLTFLLLVDIDVLHWCCHYQLRQSNMPWTCGRLTLTDGQG